MARPVNANAEETRRRILDTARGLFAERGMGGTSIRDIAAGAGVSLATIHHYFVNKDGLYESCIAAMYEELEALRAQLETAIAAGGSGSELVERVIRATFRFALEHKGAQRLVMRTVLDRGELDAERRARYHLPMLDRAPMLQQLVGVTPTADVRLVVQSMMYLVVRYALTNPSELALVAGIDGAESEGRALDAVEDHLVRTAKTLLGMPAS